jgi:hypothetical protein
MEASTGCLHALAQLRQQRPPDASPDPISLSAVYVKVDELARKLGKPMTMVPWLAEEDRVVDRFAQALAAGRHESVLDAARACKMTMDRQHARSEGQRGRSRAAATSRSLHSLRHRMQQRLNDLGLSWFGIRLTDEEERVVSRHARALTEGRYHDASRAADACAAALARVADPAARHRPLHFVTLRRRIYSRARHTGRSWGYTRWHPQEDAIVRRYADAVVSGKYPMAQAALQDCRRELGSSGRHPGRPAGAVRARLQEYVRALGLEHYPRWRESEERLYRRYLGLLIEGRYKRVRDAAEACAVQIQRLRGRVRQRSATAVYTRMNHEVSQLGLPRFKGATTPTEQRLIEAYARAADRGKYRNWLLAAEACLAELRQQYGQARRSGLVKVRRVSGHTLSTVHSRLIVTAHRLGLLGVGGRDWTDDEQKLCDAWVRWYERHRHAVRPPMWREAAEGLQEELQQKGYGRTVCACVSRLQTTRRQFLG